MELVIFIMGIVIWFYHLLFTTERKNVQYYREEKQKAEDRLYRILKEK